ncbi:conjugal transfer protein TraF [Haemophilus influenzae biotype aegyptius]|nr:type IV secretion system protein VirB10 [Haemophilus influenzae]AAM64133.1 TraI-like protein [Haemophilus influenzae biotype aegyptius]TMQ40902.1 conjugal transfer protein TraF [Haemophilus influenzae biotype aegyptius]TMQ40994.1 conjugal transfer protein TraF [Haemophilus influenzae biotype aegyptius]TMQ41753.1 conjugal transfer protein TraF [Haemophilus influenzae biotype aegyptius]TMQ45308.1 conjugal transfer protein TraF [Haemophilus influenzae biotype aegyptius]
MSNEDLGKITDIDDSASRNIIETGIPRKKGNKLLNIILLSLGGLIVLCLAAYYIFSIDTSDPDLEGIQVKKDEALINPQESGNSLAAQMEVIRKRQAEEERLRREAEEAERLRKLKEQEDKQAEELQQAEIENRINGTPVVTGSQQETREPVETPEQRRLSGDVLVSLDGTSRSSRAGENDPEGIDNKLRGDVYSKGSAKLVRKRDLLLIHGTQIPCALQTRLVTDHPSILICQVTKNIYSADGSTLLIERGSKVFGEQKKAIITGQNMAFVNWSEIDTPYGVRVRIDSLGTDSLGASGLNVWVDEKWGKRFGGAILLSFIRDALATGSQIASRNSNGTVVYDNSEANTGRMAEIALEKGISIQPTGYANQGQQINILVARDIDFSDIYKVK